MSTIDNPQQMVRMAQAGPPAFGGGAPPAGLAAGGGGDGGGISAGDVMRVINQRKLMIVLIFLFVYALIVAATVLVWRFDPRYASDAYIVFRPPPAAAFDLAAQVLPQDYVERRLNTEAAQLLSTETLLDLLSQQEIKATSFYRSYGEGKDAQMECLYDLKDELSISPVRDSDLIRVALSTRNRSEATLIVNTLVERYVNRQRIDASDTRQQQLNRLKDTQAAVNTQLEEVRRRIANLRAQRDMPALEAERDVLQQNIAVLSNTKAELLAREAQANAELQTYSGVDPRNLPVSQEMLLMIDSDPEVRMYRQQVEALDVQINVARKNLVSDNHRHMKLLKSQRDEYFQREQSRRETLADQLRARQYEQLGQELARIRNTLAEVQDQLAGRENELRDLDGAITRLTSLQKDEERYGRELERVNQAVTDAQTTHSLQEQQGNFEVAARAKDAVLPSRPQPLIWLGGGFILALAVGFGFAFLRELTDKQIRTPVDIARYGRLSVLGSVPELDDDEAEIDDVEAATRVAPQSIIAESFRQIRAHLMFSGPIESQRLLLITSPRSEDGKTAVAVNLAVTLAQGSQRVLLIDCNFRRPGVRGAFRESRPDGLSNVLVGRNTFADVVTRTEVPGLDIVSSGPMPPNPAELLGSPQMRELLENARKSYDRVILDGPPCLLISDALVLAIQMDAVIMVARAGLSSKGAVKRARDQLQRINARVIGAVLNGVRARPGGYFRQQYREFYDYTNEEVVPPELTAPNEIETDATEPEPDDLDNLDNLDDSDDDRR